MRRSLQKEHDDHITALYFDGRKDRTLTQVEVNHRWYRESKFEEHYVFVSEPGGRYVTHFTPKSSKSADIANSILEVIKGSSLEDSIAVIDCDSANVNTGCSSGVIRRLEEALKRPLQIFVCMLHTNELPLRHLFLNLDGFTTGATTFSGPIGRAFHECEKMPVVPFASIVDGHPPVDLPQDVVDDLSEDQQYLYRIISAIRSGSVNEKLSALKPRTISHSRWITFANRVCRLYIATINPSKALKTIVHFIVVYYAPLWFEIKSKPACTDGPKHVLSAIRAMRSLPPDVQKWTKPYLSRNSYFAHVENVLLAMLADSSRCKREKAINEIIKARKGTQKLNTVRQFKVPFLNYDATDYDEVIMWDANEVTEPPLTMKLTDSEILNIIEVPLPVPKYPNHFQAVERIIKLVTEASGAVCGFDSRDGYIRSGMYSRQITPHLHSKKDLTTMITD